MLSTLLKTCLAQEGSRSGCHHLAHVQRQHSLEEAVRAADNVLWLWPMALALEAESWKGDIQSWLAGSASLRGSTREEDAGVPGNQHLQYDFAVRWLVSRHMRLQAYLQDVPTCAGK